MANNDDEFNNVIKGLPPEDTTRKSGANFVLLFTIVGLVAALAVFLFQDLIFGEGRKLLQYGFIPEQMIWNGILSLLVGSVQAWVFKTRIIARVHLFIIFSVIGGLVAGLIGGMLIDSGLRVPILVGGINGALAGGLSSLSQNKIMRNNKHGQMWFLYSAISWSLIFGVGWIIGWQATNAGILALAAVFLMISSGISLVFFLNRVPQIEFS